MDNNEDVLLKMFEEYIAKCHCADKDDCTCMPFSQFTDEVLLKLSEQWAESYIDDREEDYA